jgi:3-deoxy-D-arabino-heptulosonate 7-phosphate (DAHP) synthase class II
LQNNYASALCGTLQLVIGAAVNHDQIAEIILETVPDIAEQATRVASALLFVRTSMMRQHFSQLYAQVFQFYRAVIEWYMKPRTVRFFSSFNGGIKIRYEKTVPRIQDIKTEMYNLSNLAHHAWCMIESTEQQRRAQTLQQRQ